MSKFGVSKMSLHIKSNYLGIKRLTYFLLIILLANAGTVISEPVSKLKAGSRAGSFSQKVLCSTSVDNYKLHAGPVQSGTDGTGGFMPAIRSEQDGYLYKNFLLSEKYIYHNSNSGRAVIWFTSRFRN